jgi:hypothetical protein
VDKAGPAYWNGLWEGNALNDIVDPNNEAISNTVNRRFHSPYVNCLARKL